MKIRKIILQGFTSYLAKTSFKFESSKTYLVYGENGSGKSSLFIEAIFWVLFDKTYRQLKVEDLVADGAEECIVRIFTDIGVIKRIRTLSGASKAYLDDVYIEQSKLESLLKINKELFMNSVVFGQGICGFMLLQDADKKNLVAQINSNVLDGYLMKLKELSGGLALETNELERRIEILEGQERKAIELKEQLREMKSANLAEKTKIENYKKELEKKMIELKQTKRTIQEKIDALEEDSRKFTKKTTLIKTEIQDLIYVVKGCEADKNKLEQGLNILKQKKCDKCYSTIDDSAQKRVREIIQPEIDKQTLIIKKTNKKINELEEIKEEYLKKVRFFEKKMEPLEDEQDMVNRESNTLRGKIEQLNEQLDDFDKNKKTEKLFMVNKEELSQIRKEIQDIRGMRDNILIPKKEACGFWEERFRTFRSQMFANILKNFVPTCNKFLSGLSNGEYQIDIETHLSGKKKIIDKLVTLIFYKGKRIDLKRLSGGEKKKIALAMNMSFSILMNKYYAGDWNLVVFDEAFDALDFRTRDKVMLQLIELSKDTGKTVVVIAHESIRAEGMELVQVLKNKITGSYLMIGGG